ncbi:MAG: hypothetical protein M1813_007487 [Trichoglossum hirsutum]|nr:MAG: hypothetical protein M1813_007487 [Trichoglossum hirsutum]
MKYCIVYRPKKGELGLYKPKDLDGKLRFTPVKAPKFGSRLAVTMVDSFGFITMVVKLDSLPGKVRLKRHFGLCNQIFVEGIVLVPADSEYATETSASNGTNS